MQTSDEILINPQTLLADAKAWLCVYSDSVEGQSTNSNFCCKHEDNSCVLGVCVWPRITTDLNQQENNSLFAVKKKINYEI